MSKEEDKKKEEKEEKRESHGGVTFHGKANLDHSWVAGGNISGTQNIGGTTKNLTEVFAPLYEVAQQAPPEKQEVAVEKVEKLQEEVAKGEKADDGLVAGLLEDLVELVPGAVTAVGTIFGQPLLAGLVGPVTKYVLKKITGSKE